MADVNYIITIDDRDALKALSDMKVGFNSVGTAANKEIGRASCRERV